MELVIMKDKQAVTTSLQVAEGFGKQHKNVIQAIEDKIQSAENSAHYKTMFSEGVYKDSRNRDQKIYYMNRDGFTFIAFGFTGTKADEFKLRYIQAFNDMENHIKQNQLAIPQSPMEALQLMFDVQKETNIEVNDVKNRVVNLEENTKLDAGEYNYINRRVRQRVTEVGRGYGSLTAKQRGELFRDMGNGINQIAGIQTRTQLKQKDFKMVCDFINDWEPSTATKTIIRQMSLDLKE